MIIRKGNAVVRSLRKKKLFEVMKEYGDLWGRAANTPLIK